MTWVGVALDTCLLRGLEDGPLDEYWIRIDVVSRLRRSMNQGDVRLLLDHEGHILKEYENLPPDRLGRRFVSQALKTGTLYYVSGSLSGDARRALTKHGVDNDDFPFIAAAQAVQGYYVTTEVKHLSPPRRKLIAQHCMVTVARLEELPDLFPL